MPKPQPLPVFGFAEIMIAAPWAARILAQNSDNDKVVMLHCNNAVDEGSSDRPAADVLAVERAARAERTRMLGAALERAGRRVSAAVRSVLGARGQPRTES